MYYASSILYHEASSNFVYVREDVISGERCDQVVTLLTIVFQVRISRKFDEKNIEFREI